MAVPQLVHYDCRRVIYHVQGLDPEVYLSMCRMYVVKHSLNQTTRPIQLITWESLLPAAKFHIATYRAMCRRLSVRLE
jgi:hypothetical protein